MAQVTLRDVAEEAGVHISTASRALNPETRSIVNEETAKKVSEAASKLGYRPHPFARGLRTNRTNTIGMVVPDLMNPLFPPIFRGAEAVLAEAGYSVLVANGDNNADTERAVTTTLLERRVDGLILATARRSGTMLDEFLKAEIPIVLVNRLRSQAPSGHDWPDGADPTNVAGVTTDDHDGIGQVVKHLASLGHRRIAHVAGPSTLLTSMKRREAYEAWLRIEGLEFDPSLVVEAERFQVDPGAEACQRLLDSGAEFTAIVAANDLIAIGCLDVLRRAGRSVPGDVSVTGYNDMLFMDRINPPLTTVGLPNFEMGSMAARMLLDQLGRDDTKDTKPVSAVSLAPTLVVRESTAPPKA
ncbi:MAG: LacI family DNA-binding transcriptional regulator [Acidimicrobiia bacterium]|nr:LacI family DNA-binding transcriptional regulator [Acidimicrobiia bacterium]